jgi:hypothetical protein
VGLLLLDLDFEIHIQNVVQYFCSENTMKLGAFFGAALLGLIAEPAIATTVDFSDYPTFTGGPVANYSSISNNFGSSFPVDATYHTVTGIGFNDPSVTGEMLFWNGAYSGDDAAFPSTGPSAGEVRLDAYGGQKIKSFSVTLGGYPNSTRTGLAVVLYSGTGATLFSSLNETITGMLGGTTFTYTGLNLDAVAFRFLLDWNVGVNSFSYTTGPNNTSSVPLPAALPLLGFALAGLGVARRRKTKVYLSA